MAQRILRGVIGAGDRVVDATAGNGHDTLFLAEAVGEDGRVLAFDVQECAIAEARARLEEAGLVARVEFYLESHANLALRAGVGTVAAAMWNLGYLPGGDHGVTTAMEETLLGMDAVERVLKPGGWLTVVCYPGHPGGESETAAVMDWLRERAERGWRVARYDMPWTRRPAPCLMVAVKG